MRVDDRICDHDWVGGGDPLDHHIRNFTSVWKQDTRIQELEEDGSQRDGGAAL